MSTKQIGNETRGSILPSKQPEDTGFILPNYDFSANLRRPAQIGVRRDNSFGSVLDAAKGVAYYMDTIGFGESSSSFTRGMPFDKLGINFFTKSGLTCDNGADMWLYFEGIPRGDALGSGMQKAMAEMKLPQLKGLAPGMIEDSKAALNPKPVLQAVFGTPYPKCKRVRLPVGDSRGRTRDDQTGDVWVLGPTEVSNGLQYQTRWVQDTKPNGDPIYLSREQYDAAPKTMNPDGTPKKKEGFDDGRKHSLLLAIVLLSLAYACVGKR